MRYPKRILFFLLFFSLFLNNPVKASETSNDPVCLKLYLNDGGRSMKDAPMVVSKINEYIEPKLGFQIDIEFLPASNYDRILGQKFLSEENFDILYCNTLDVSRFYQNVQKEGVSFA